MKKVLTILFTLIYFVGHSQEFDFSVKGGGYKRMSRYDSTAVADSIQAARGNNYANFYLKDSSLSSPRTVGLSGNRLDIIDAGGTALTIDPTQDGENINLGAVNNTDGGNTAGLSLSVTPTSGDFIFRTFFNDAATQATIEGAADASSSILNYTSNTHTFNAGTHPFTSSPTVLTLTNDVFSLNNGGISDLFFINSAPAEEKTLMLSKSSETADAVSFMATYSNSSDGYRFYNYATNGSNIVTVVGDAANNTVEVGGRLVLNGVTSGISTDSVLVISPANNIVFRRASSSFAMSDSSVWQPKYRSDTNRINVYTLFAGKQASGNYAIADSSVWQPTFRSDTNRINVYTSLAGKLSTATAASTYLPLAGGTMTGNLLFTDNTFDIGASAATRPRTGYFGTSLISPLVNGLRIVNNGTDTLDIAAGKKLAISTTMTLAAGANNQTFTFPSTTASIARIDAAQTFVGTQTFSGIIINGGTGLFPAAASANNIFHRENIATGISMQANGVTTSTSGARSTWKIGDSWSPPSGTATLSVADFSIGSYIQSGGANGIVRFIDGNPSTTGLVDARFLDIRMDTGFAIYQSSAMAFNYFLGKIGAGTSTISAQLHTLSTTEQLRVGYDATHYMSVTTVAAGSTTFELTGTSPTFTFGKAVSVTGSITSSDNVQVGVNKAVLDANNIWAINGTGLHMAAASTVAGWTSAGAGGTMDAAFSRLAAGKIGVGTGAANSVAGTLVAANIGIGQSTPTAYLHLAAGTATASTAPLKFTSGTNLTAVENGTIEYNGTDFFGSSNSIRYKIVKVTIGTAAPATTPSSTGEQFVDTTNKKMYVAAGTASSADWIILN